MPGYSAAPDSITQDDLDALAAASTRDYGLTCSGVTSLEGLQYLNDPELWTLSASSGQVSDLTPLAGLTSLRNLFIQDNQISDIGPLAGLANLRYLDLTNNNITSVTPLSGLIMLQTLQLSNNQISDLAPLTGLTALKYLDVSSNKITDVTPLASLTALPWLDVSGNQVTDITPLAGLTALTRLFLHDNHITSVTPIASILNGIGAPVQTMWYWTLDNNNIADLSALDWNMVGQEWLTVPSEYSTGVFNNAVTNQSLTQTAVSNTTVPLPAVAAPANDPNPITWTVKSGDATINQAAGTITYKSAGPVQLTWSDSFDVNCRPSYGATTPCSPGNPTRIPVSFFSGTVAVNVTDSGTQPPVPSGPNSGGGLENLQSTATAGTARLADGTDPYTFVVTVRDAGNVPLTGQTGAITVTTQAGVTLSGITDNGNGTYTLAATCATPGNYTVTINVAGADVALVMVNFVASETRYASRTAGDIQNAVGLGFIPGEQVTVTVHSSPLDLGTFKADANGKVVVSFTVPADFATGRHTVEFVGAMSGKVITAFDVIAKAPSNPKGPNASAQSGGFATPESTSASLFALVISLALASMFVVASKRVRRTR